MYERFKHSLIEPSALPKYLKDTWTKVICYFFLLLILACLPFLMVIYSTQGFTNLEKSYIKENFIKNLSGDHKIEDGTLVIDHSSALEAKYLRLESYMIGIISTPQSSAFPSVRLIFVDEGIRVSMFGVKTTLYAYDSVGLENYDFGDYSVENIDRFIKAIDLVIKDNSGLNQSFQAFVVLISTAVEFMFFILIGAAFSKHPLPFKYKFKISTYVVTIYAVCSLFALFLSSELFIFMGIILMIVYMQKAFSKLTMV